MRDDEMVTVKLPLDVARRFAQFEAAPADMLMVRSAVAVALPKPPTPEDVVRDALDRDPYLKSPEFEVVRSLRAAGWLKDGL